ncbi:MAG: acyl-CoA dehydrogenase family protein [Acidimicrobiia bacterium]|nr:acyl-CoA dehydrogenase family protein [Acidimicrobiia bacterium]
MRFAFTDDQVAFRDAVRDLLAKECPPEVVRAAWPEGEVPGGAKPGEGARADADRLDAVWRALADMGVLGIAVAEEHGGLGMDELNWVLIAEETGYAALPHPFVETVCVAAPLLGRADLADGSATATVQPGRDEPVPWASADVLLAIDRDAWTLTVHDEWEADAVASVDGARQLASVRASGGEEVGGAALAFDRGALGTAAQLVGLGRRMLDLTVAYVVERKQFGVQIGSFQAVKHHLADAALDLTFAAPAVHRAAWSLATASPDASRDVSMAKAMASDAAHRAGRAALQCHGAIGYTVEYDLHLYVERAAALSRAWGTAAWHRGRVGRALEI